MKNNKSIWWREYRKRLYKPNVKNMSIEMVIRINFRKTLKEYLENCSLAGVQRMWDREQSIEQRTIRIVLFGLMLGTIAYFLQNLWFENLARPMIVTTESTTYPISNIEFPAVALCNFNRISKQGLEKMVKRDFPSSLKNNKTEEVIKSFFRQLGSLVDYSYNKSLEAQPLYYSFANFIDNRNIVQLMELLAPSCSKMLVRCSWAGVLVECDTIFKVQRTVHGHCCTFNLVTGDTTGRSAYAIKRQHQPGQLQGLNVILDPLVEDYTYTTFNMFGFEVLIFDATHYADPTGGNMIQRIAQPDQAVFLEIYAVKQIATEEVRKYPPKTVTNNRPGRRNTRSKVPYCRKIKLKRKCLFHDEMKDQFHDLYSYSACIVRCRINTVKSLCKCTPYYFPFVSKDDPICTMDHLRCLNRYKEKLFYLFPKDAINTEGLEAELQDALYCVECLPDCELTRHSSKHSKIPLSSVANQNKEHNSFFFEGLNMSGKCLLSIYQATTDGVLNRLDIVSYWFEVLSNVGGFSGMLIGFSLISILEFAYFFVLRFFWNLYCLYNNPKYY